VKLSRSGHDNLRWDLSPFVAAILVISSAAVADVDVPIANDASFTQMFDFRLLDRNSPYQTQTDHQGSTSPDSATRLLTSGGTKNPLRFRSTDGATIHI
jgi:hypothetical protein